MKLDLKALQDSCKHREEIKATDENRWQLLAESQKKYGTCYHPIRKWLGIDGLGKPKCPCCKQKLEKENISYDGTYRKSILFCINGCGYQFAEIWRE